MAHAKITINKLIPGDDIIFQGKRRTVNEVASFADGFRIKMEPLGEEGEINFIKVNGDQEVAIVGTSYDPAKHGRPLST